MKVNRKMFDLHDVYTNFSHVQTIKMLDKLTNYKDKLEVRLFQVRLGSIKVEAPEIEMDIIEEQLDYVDENINTLETAILCFETDTFEKFKTRTGIAVFSLN